MKKTNHQSDFELLQAEPKVLSATKAGAKAKTAAAAPAKPEISTIVKGADKPMSSVEHFDVVQKGRQPLWGPNVKYSDQVANGDHFDDKELEDEDDPNDAIVDDDGFVNQWQHDPAKLAEWARAHKVSTQQAAQLLT